MQGQPSGAAPGLAPDADVRLALDVDDDVPGGSGADGWIPFGGVVEWVNDMHREGRSASRVRQT
jgi:hypothetical protein